MAISAEAHRLEEDHHQRQHWKRWGPYLSERAWGTVREDYSAAGTAWEYFPHDHARSRAYRWNEDGLAGISDRHQRICFALALWNERDPILKERLFGLTGNEGNHGEDVKEYYFYLDSTPTHSYMKWLYKYPQAAFPYVQLIEENARRSRTMPEFELMDTGIFDGQRYFDVFVEYAKGDPEDLLIDIVAINRGPQPAPIHLLPTIWFRNTWAWGHPGARPALQAADTPYGAAIALDEPTYGRRWLHCERSDVAPALLFTENDTNTARLLGVPGPRYAKDGINDAIVAGRAEAVNPARRGTKASAHWQAVVPAGGRLHVRLRLTDKPADAWTAGPFSQEFDDTFRARRTEADAFYEQLASASETEDARQVTRQAFAGLLWSKQYYHYVVKEWLEGDPGQPPPERQLTRNREWSHLFAADVISMPDKWEYPWYAAWDLAFHCVPLALVDADFAKSQLVLMLREWYMHPNGQLSAYEWAFGDANPPVHAWAAWRVYKIEKRRRGVGDRVFLERIFQKLLLNFTWWVNRKDADGLNVFQGGFLGLDNIGIFDRSKLPTGGYLHQSDGTSWMAMYSLNMMAIALELADGNPAYEDMASKFWEHFLHIARAMGQRRGQEGLALWDDEDGFFYDVLHLPNGSEFPLKVRSMVGLIPLFAVETIEPALLARLPAFRRRLDWFVSHRSDLTAGTTSVHRSDGRERRLLSVLDPQRLRRVLAVMLDEREFLSPFGIRALSRVHQDHPYAVQVNGTTYRVDYEPGESATALFGGNSNWRGPIWFPVNFLLIESLQKFHHVLGDDFKVECPVGSGQLLTLWEVAAELARRLSRLFLRDHAGRRPIYGDAELFQTDPHWRDLTLFHEYFHGDSGVGLGASHQTGWTALVAKLLQQTGSSVGHDADSLLATLALEHLR